MEHFIDIKHDVYLQIQFKSMRIQWFRLKLNNNNFCVSDFCLEYYFISALLLYINIETNGITCLIFVLSKHCVIDLRMNDVDDDEH